MSILNSPVTINGLALKNRLVMPPMATSKAAQGGAVTDDLCAYYAERAAGGCIGLIVTEHCFVSPEGRAHAGQLSIASDADIPGLRRLTDTIHAHGSKAMAQISHAGGAAQPGVPGLSALSPSGVRLPRDSGEGPAPDVMAEADIEKVIRDFAAAARRAKAAGYDGVELHSAHGYLLNQFFSPLTNRRTDRYAGGTLEGRTRLHCEVLRAVRAAVGAKYPVAVRLGACDYMAGGSTEADAAEAAALLEAAGADLLDISGGLCGYRNPQSRAPGYFSAAAEAVRQRVSAPVLLTGGVTAAGEAEALLGRGCADLIGVGRALLKDAGWARSALGGVQ